jgi:hypothetical protein
MTDAEYKSNVEVDILKILPNLLDARDKYVALLKEFHRKCFESTAKRLDAEYAKNHTISWFSRVILRRRQPDLKKHPIEEAEAYFFSGYYLHSSINDCIKSEKLSNIVTELNSLIVIANKSKMENLEVRIVLSKKIRDIVLCK